MSARSAVVPPIVISDETAPRDVRMASRRFRRFVRKHAIPHVLDGRRMYVRADRFLDALDRLSGVDPRRSAQAWDEDAVVRLAAQSAKRAGTK